jgi:hypothetical protein
MQPENYIRREKTKERTTKGVPKSKETSEYFVHVVVALSIQTKRDSLFPWYLSVFYFIFPFLWFL